jgi:D-threo-aldose 1-dehydrogenase
VGIGQLQSYGNQPGNQSNRAEAREHGECADWGEAAKWQRHSRGRRFADHLRGSRSRALPIEQWLDQLDPDLFLLAGRYTLLEQATGFMDACQRRGVGVVIGGPYNSGVLVRQGGTFNYAPAPPDVLAKVERLGAVCRRFETPLEAAALQFAGAHPAVASVIPGGQTPDEVLANVALCETPIPAGLWDALKAEGLIAADAPIPRSGALAAC